jgi:hypothetical protein
MYDYESIFDASTIEPSTTTYFFNTAQVTANPDDPFTPVALLVQKYYEEAESGTSTMSVDEIKLLITMLREQSLPVDDFAFDAYEEYAAEYDPEK